MTQTKTTNTMKLSWQAAFAALFGITLTIAPNQRALACSRVLWTAEGQPVLVGRNLDWTQQMGAKLYAMPKGIKRNGATPVNPMEWTSKYGSVVTVIWDGATVDGLNEAGLAANLLYLAESDFGERDPSKKGLSISVFTQYLLDNFATVAEVVEALDSLQIRTLKLTHHGIEVDGPVHWAVADKTGDSAIIEVLDGKFSVHHGKQYKVMTNSPTYANQLVLAKQYQGLGGDKPIPGTEDSPDRFARGAHYLNLLPADPANNQEAVAGVFSVIRNMATPFGANDPEKPNIAPTWWRTVSDLTNGRYYFEFTTNPNVVWVDIQDLNLAEGAPVQRYDLRSDVNAAGEVSGNFKATEDVKFYMAGTVVNWKPSDE